MATDKLRTAVREVFVLAELGSNAARSDGQLLRDFAARRDEAAFALLVRRHGQRPSRKRLSGSANSPPRRLSARR